MEDKNYKKLYEEALSRAKELRRQVNANETILVNSDLDTIFPELKESEDEKIKKGIESILKHYKENGEIVCPYPFVKIDECLSWLEKQSEQKLCMIQWKGDNLKEVIGFTGKNKNFDKWFTSFEEYERYVHEHNNIFKLFNEDGSHYEVPVGAWIVKTPDGYNVASKAVLKQKSADKVDPKFKIGDWVVYNRDDSSREIIQVYDIIDGRYYFTYNIHFSWSIKECDEKSHLWTIQDAKDGDVLVYPDGTIALFKYRLDGLNSGIYMSHILLATNKIETCQSCAISKDLHPATKEQCDFLFQKMKEAGYEWDAEKKKLKKIEQKPIWSKEGEANIDYSSEIIGFLKNYIKAHGCTAMNSWVNWLKNIKDRVQLQPKQEWDEANDSMIEGIKIAILDYYDKENADEIISWLESLKERVQPQPKYHWKPSKEQMEALNAINNIGELSYVEQSDLLVKLYNDLKKL